MQSQAQEQRWETFLSLLLVFFLSSCCDLLSDGTLWCSFGCPPFTVIIIFHVQNALILTEPNHGVAYYQVRCPCVTSFSCIKYIPSSDSHGVQKLCKPRYGTCQNGVRKVSSSLSLFFQTKLICRFQSRCWTSLA